MNSAIGFMNRALELAQIGRGYVSPNPMVGCVVVFENNIIGEGWHRQHGQAHAEVNAIYDVIKNYPDNHDILLSQSSVYVTLEPCSHFGKTPPCADLLIEKKVKKVIICNHDPNPLVAGKGIEKLKNAEIEVIQNVLETEGREINKRFFTFIEKQRPYIILKWAETSDGFIANDNGSPIQISNALSQIYSHKMRAEEDAIMVGTNTALNDNPRLNTRYWNGKNPVRVVIDKTEQLPENLHLFDGSQKTIYYSEPWSEPWSVSSQTSESKPWQSVKTQTTETSVSSQTTESKPWQSVKTQTTETIQTTESNLTVQGILSDLHRRNIQSLIVEGGQKLLQSFLDKGFYDEIRVFKSKKLNFKGIQSPKIPFGIKLMESKNLMEDEMRIYKK